MPFDPADHLAQCKAAVSSMNAMKAGSAMLAKETTQWDALTAACRAICDGAAKAHTEIDEGDIEPNCDNNAYLAMLNLAPVILGLELKDLANTGTRMADSQYKVIRDFANNIRDPFNKGYPEIGAIAADGKADEQKVSV